MAALWMLRKINSILVDVLQVHSSLDFRMTGGFLVLNFGLDSPQSHLKWRSKIREKYNSFNK